MNRSARTSLLVLFLAVGLPVSAALPVQTPSNPDRNSRTLVQQAWTAYEAKKYDLAMQLVDECIASLDTLARQQQASLKGPIDLKSNNLYWALNDVATAKLIKAKLFADTNRPDKAKAILSDIIYNYSYAMSYDPKGGGFYWNVAEAAKAMMGDGSADDGSSGALKAKAADALKAGDFQSAKSYADKCIDLFQEAALIQQKELSKYPDEKKIQRYWALNDVGTCYYVGGKAEAGLGDTQKAQARFDFIKEKLSYASYWDPNGWYVRLTDLLSESDKPASDPAIS